MCMSVSLGLAALLAAWGETGNMDTDAGGHSAFAILAVLAFGSVCSHLGTYPAGINSAFGCENHAVMFGLLWTAQVPTNLIVMGLSCLSIEQWLLPLVYACGSFLAAILVYIAEFV